MSDLVPMRLTSYLGKILTLPLPAESERKNDCLLSVYKLSGGPEIPVYILASEAAKEAAVNGDETEYTGKVIGILSKRNRMGRAGRPIAFLLSDGKKHYHQGELAKALLSEQESELYVVTPLYHKSCGAIIYRKQRNHLEFLLLKEKTAESWGFPKGHMEFGESESETAIREVYEEAGFLPKLRSDFREEIHYRIAKSCQKQVVFFLAEYSGSIRPAEQEIEGYVWVSSKSFSKYCQRQNLIDMMKKAEELVLST